MSNGAIYTESWWGDTNAASGWGSIYPFNAEGSTVSTDSNEYTADTNVLTTDNNDGFGAAALSSFSCTAANFAVANGTTGATISLGTDATVSLGTLNSVNPTTYQQGTSTYTANITIPAGYSNSGLTLTDCVDDATGSGNSPGTLISTRWASLSSFGGTNITFVYNGTTYFTGLTDTLSDITNLNGNSGSTGSVYVQFDTSTPDVGSYVADGFGTFINSSNTHGSNFGPFAAYATPKYFCVRENVPGSFGNPFAAFPIYKVEQANGFIKITQKITS